MANGIAQKDLMNLLNMSVEETESVLTCLNATVLKYVHIYRKCVIGKRIALWEMMNISVL